MKPLTEMPHCYLKPGELIVAEEPLLVSTLLGSCVSVTMFSARHRIAAINHGVMPSCKECPPDCQKGCDEGTRYVDCSLYRMLEYFRQRGILPPDLDVKLFGGADMFDRNGSARSSIGNQNIKKAMEIIRSEGLKLLASDIGGMRGRKIYFSTATGDVWVKRLNGNEEACCTN